MQIDHVLYGVQDLTDATAWFEESFGLRPVSGGEHPGWGTANAIVPVGNGQYVEMIAVVDRSCEHPLARALTALVSEGDRPVAVCLRPDDLDETARRLDLQVTDGERLNPDGRTLRWRLAGLQHALGPDRLPFFIEWPGRGTNPELDVTPAPDGDGVGWVELGGEPNTLRRWIGDDSPTISVVEGAPGITRFTLRRTDGTVAIGAR